MKRSIKYFDEALDIQLYKDIEKTEYQKIRCAVEDLEHVLYLATLSHLVTQNFYELFEYLSDMEAITLEQFTTANRYLINAYSSLDIYINFIQENLMNRSKVREGFSFKDLRDNDPFWRLMLEVEKGTLNKEMLDQNDMSDIYIDFFRIDTSIDEALAGIIERYRNRHTHVDGKVKLIEFVESSLRKFVKINSDLRYILASLLVLPHINRLINNTAYINNTYYYSFFEDDNLRFTAFLVTFMTNVKRYQDKDPIRDFTAYACNSKGFTTETIYRAE